MLAVFVCVEDGVVWRGRVYGGGEVYDGPWEESPVDQPGWAQREPNPAELSPDDTLGLGGRQTMNWRKITTAMPDVEPVVAGFDTLHDEPIIDEEATEQKELVVDKANREGMPEPRPDESIRRQLEYMREADPDWFADFLKRCPEEAERLGFLRGKSKGSTPEEVRDISTELTPTPPADPVEQADDQDLDRLLKEEIAALNDGDEELLAEIRKQIEIAMMK